MSQGIPDHSNAGALSSNRSENRSPATLLLPQNAPLGYIDTIDNIEVLQEVAVVHQSTVRWLQAAQASTAMQLASAERDYAYVQDRIRVLQVKRGGNVGQPYGVVSSSSQTASGPVSTGTASQRANPQTGFVFDPSQLSMDYSGWTSPGGHQQ